MPTVKPEIFRMDRRSLLKLTGTMGIGATFVNPSELWAAGACEKVEIDNGQFTANDGAAALKFWIDGIMYGSRSNLKTRANLTLFVPLPQSDEVYVQSVTLMRPDKTTLGTRWFDASMKMKHDHDNVPYVRFENLDLDSSKTYYCVYTVKAGNDVKLYKYDLVNPKPSTLTDEFLPKKIADDFTHFILGNAESKTPGLFTTPFQYYTKNGLDKHTARGRVQSIDSNSGDFAVDIDFMHDDASAEHYMRYFLVLDPVGRILGVRKRKAFHETGTDIVLNVKTTVRQVNEATQTEFAINEAQIANILDCPYIQFFTEDSYDALARNMIRLR